MADRANMANLAPWLKETYSPIMEKMFDTGAITLDIIEKGDMNSPGAATMMASKVGKRIVMPAHTGGLKNAGVGVAQGHQYPRAGAQVRDQLQWVPQRLVTAIQETAEALARSDGDQAMVESVAAIEFEGAMNDTRKKENWWALGDGSSLLCSTTGTDWDNTAKTFTVDDASKLEVGMEIIARVKTTGAVAGTTNWTTTTSPYGTEQVPAIITAISGTTVTATYYDSSAIDLGGNITAEHGIYPWDSQGQVPWGLGIICDDGDPVNHGFDPSSSVPNDDTGTPKTFGAIRRDATGNEWWKAYNSDLSGTPPLNYTQHIEPVERALVSRDSMLAMKYGGIFVLSDQSQWHNIAHQLDAAKRTVTRKRITENQWDVIECGMFVFGYDPYCPSGTLYFFDPKHIHRLVLEEWGFETAGGSDRTQITGGMGRPTSVWQGNLSSYKQTLVSSCRHMARVTGLAA